jgi:LL-diaminopimelate aminotransferase
MRLARRLDSLPPYLFVRISRKIAARRARGLDVVSFGIGDPDLPTPRHIIDELCSASIDPSNHHYPETEGLPSLRAAISEWYKSRFNVKLDSEKEILPLIGSKEGIGHVSLCLVEPGDIAIIPDPGYPVYSIGTMLAGGTSFALPLREENGFLPDFSEIPDNIAQQARVLWINYPNNPTGAIAPPGFYSNVVKFASAHGIAVCHDAPYSEVSYDGYRPESFLETPGAMDIGIEFHSLSKTFNMTGWRIGMAVGNHSLINALFRVKSNLDSGIPQAIQHAAIKALKGPRDSILKRNAVYQRRRDLLVDCLIKIGLETHPPKAGFYIWAKVPRGYTSEELAEELLDQCGVVVTPGSGYGQYGEGYIRFSITVSDVQLEKGISLLSAWNPALTRKDH